MKKKLILATFATSLFLSGCSSSLGLSSNADSKLNDLVEESLGNSITRVQKALNELDKARKGDASSINSPINNSPIENTVAARKGNKVIVKSNQVDSNGNLLVASKGIDTKSTAGQQAVLSVLDQRVNLKWKGEANELIKSLSKKIGFDYSENGAKQHLPVDINAKNKSIKEIFGMIDQLINSKGNIYISRQTKTVAFTYK